MRGMRGCPAFSPTRAARGQGLQTSCLAVDGVVPSPLVGEGQGGGELSQRILCGDFCSLQDRAISPHLASLPNPPSLTLPHKVGESHLSRGLLRRQKKLILKKAFL